MIGSTSTSHSARRCTTPASVDAAFDHYARGNALRLTLHPYAPRDVHKLVDRSIAAFSAEMFAERSGGCESPDPIFIVGMPRAGSTLLEQILSSHSAVEGTSELQDIPILARREEKYPRSALDLDEEERRALGEEYLKRTAVQRRTDKPFFIDKLPNNWMLVPFIQPDPAEREDHRRTPAPSRLLLLELPAAFRARSDVDLRPRAPRPLLFGLCPADGACRHRAARAESTG